MTHDKIQQLNKAIDALCAAGNILEALGYNGLTDHIDTLIIDLDYECFCAAETTPAVVTRK